MGYELIITEKPSSAKKIAEALAKGKPTVQKEGQVSYYVLKHECGKEKKDILVCSAVGHLFNLAEKSKNGEEGKKGKEEKKTKREYNFPVFEIEWKPSYEIGKGAEYTRKYINVIKKLSKKADSFVVATDFDIEGEVIGWNCIRFLAGRKDAARMKYSTVTKADLIESYENKLPHLEWGQAKAGETRHILDWLYGINISRALTYSIKKAGMFKIMSAGRVQGPALKTIVEKEKEIRKFKPEPYWEIELKGEKEKKKVDAIHKEGKIMDKERADEIIKNTKGAKEGTIKKVSKSKRKIKPPIPFDLTSLQTEAYGSLRISPKQTLEIAQTLYTEGLISYPRTSSQILPKEIGYRKILNSIGKQGEYKALVNKLLGECKVLSPNNGKKKDPAHPAIFPTGEYKALSGREKKVYDLIVRRFISTFGEDAERESMSVEIDVNNEMFKAKGIRTTEEGWFCYYRPHLKLEEEELPEMKEGEKINVEKIKKVEKETQPPKRYTPASIIKELEKRELGTKATRADIVENLLKRDYVRKAGKGSSLEATDFGIKLVESLEKYIPEIVDEAMTRKFEEEMENIREGKYKEEKTIEEAKANIIEVIEKLKKNAGELGKELKGTFLEAEKKANTLGGCPECGGSLVIKRGKYGRFIACDNYPECKVNFKIPQKGMIKVTEEKCEECGHPMIEVKQARQKPQLLCINASCKSKMGEEALKADREMKEKGELGKKCPKCGKPLVLRKSIYGQFYGCSGFPKCRFIEKVGDKEKEEHYI